MASVSRRVTSFYPRTTVRHLGTTEAAAVKTELRRRLKPLPATTGPVPITLTHDESAILDALCDTWGCSQSEALNRLLDRAARRLEGI